MNEEIKCYKVETETKIPVRKLNEDGKEVQNEEVKRRAGYYLVKSYDKSELDYGDSRAHDPEYRLELHADDDGVIVGNRYDLNCWFENDVSSVICELSGKDGLKPLDFLEKDIVNHCGIRCKVRVTALAESPRICKDKCVWRGSRPAAHCILIYGKPFVEDKKMTSVTKSKWNVIWRADLGDWLLGLIREKVAAAVGDEVTVDWGWCEGQAMFFNAAKDEGAVIRLTVTAKTESAIKRAMTALGCNDFGGLEISPLKKEGNTGSGEELITCQLALVSEV